MADPQPGAKAEKLPQSILFCCDHNSVRSPMAEGIAKKLYGVSAYLQSAGLRNDREIDGFSISVCAEIGVELSLHRSRSFEEMSEIGDDLSSYDMIVALSPASHAAALDLTRGTHTVVEFWPITDPSGAGETREAKLDAYRQTRGEILGHLENRWQAA
ncbi:low molecular weight phosphatase family protein [Alisedimentitalea sp. MJ-SS2]|uniref:arsenate-mycothiol transferase ArsC n=1 Tax=Aliisedimentitalea sp. MJ-SS2 TaxID=3049795 RepID=UPI0029092817|nr:low molecular weight phosphatase family protein [Alisedimentitalea sp. MJ-SS2]MDU8929842.1 low molecular weight phosphatase family protein [Alisedimentitalea sp. MJ-SS2]